MRVSTKHRVGSWPRTFILGMALGMMVAGESWGQSSAIAGYTVSKVRSMSRAGSVSYRFESVITPGPEAPLSFSAYLTHPDGFAWDYVSSPAAGDWRLLWDLETAEALESEFPTGVYQIDLRVDGTRWSTTLPLTAVGFPAFASITNWTQGQTIRPDEDALFLWGNSGGAIESDSVTLVARDWYLIGKTPAPGTEGAMHSGDPGWVAPMILQTNIARSIWLRTTAHRVTGLATNAIPGALGVAACVSETPELELAVGRDVHGPRLTASNPAREGTAEADARTVTFEFHEAMGPGYSVAWSTNVLAGRFDYRIEGTRLLCAYDGDLPAGEWVGWTLNPSPLGSTNRVFGGSPAGTPSLLADAAGNPMSETSGRFWVSHVPPDQPGTNITVVQLVLERSMAQKGTNAPVPDATWSGPYGYSVLIQFDGVVPAGTAATLSSPMGEPYDFFVYERDFAEGSGSTEIFDSWTFASQADLREVFPSGRYDVTVQNWLLGNRSARLGLEGDFPAPPRLRNLDGATRVVAAEPFTLTWDGLGLGPGDIVFLAVGDDYFVSNETAGGTLSYGSVSATIPARQLKPGTTYSAVLGAVRITGRDSTAFPGVEAQAAYLCQTRFNLETTADDLDIGPSEIPAATVGSPYSVQFGSRRAEGVRSWSLVQGSSLPSGLALTPDGRLSGTPTASGTNIFAVVIEEQRPPYYRASAIRRLVVNGGTSVLSAQLIEPRWLGAGRFSFRVNGIPGSSQALQSSSDLELWNPIGAITVPASGTVLVTNAIAAGQVQQFYRAVWVGLQNPRE